MTKTDAARAQNNTFKIMLLLDVKLEPNLMRMFCPAADLVRKFVAISLVCLIQSLFAPFVSTEALSGFFKLIRTRRSLSASDVDAKTTSNMLTAVKTAGGMQLAKTVPADPTSLDFLVLCRNALTWEIWNILTIYGNRIFKA